MKKQMIKDLGIIALFILIPIFVFYFVISHSVDKCKKYGNGDMAKVHKCLNI